MKLTIHTQLLAGVLSILCAGSVFAQCKPYDGYIDHKNGTVTDPRTGTVWMVCALGQTYQAGECKGLAACRTFQTRISFLFAIENVA